MKVYKALLIGSVLGTFSMPTVMADMYNNVDLGTDNTVVANTSANVAVGNMNTTDIWGIAVGSNNTAKLGTIAVGRDNTGDDNQVIIGTNNTATGPRNRHSSGTGNFVAGDHNVVEGDSSIVIGRYNSAISEYALQPITIIGNTSTAKSNGIVIGSNSEADTGNIAIGNHVRAIGRPGKVDPNNIFKFLHSDAKRDSYSLVSFGGRQVKGVEPGAMTETSMDAVNGAQLYSVAKEAMRHSTVAAEDYTYDIIVTEGKNADGSTKYKLKMADNYVTSKIPTVNSSFNITVDKYREFNTLKDNYYVSLNSDLENLNSAQFAEHEYPYSVPAADANTSEINSNEVRFDNRRAKLGSSLTAQSVQFNAEHSTSSLDSTFLIFKNSINGNTSTFSPSGFFSETKDGKRIEFSSEYITAGNQQIHDVAKGVDDTDAVNVAQLKDVERKITNIDSNVINQARSYTDGQVAKVGAGAAALAGLHPLDYNPNDKWSFGVGFGNYKNAQATALGAFYQPNEHTMFNIATTLGDNRNMVSLGANVKVGYQDPTLKMSRFEMAKQIKDLQSDNASLRTEVDEIKAALKTLQEAAVNTGRRDL
ncbi:MAG: YadA-like family protein [Veillonella sp.]|uniref:YadA-like family protein n=1 Tax=Veillonella sp. TaxID=1926307 RepID=UPI001DA93AB8|nr:YadA-like family protein [Veillonella sp.]MBS7015021.1 YadA-like family protein [Veillonella sp.]